MKLSSHGNCYDGPEQGCFPVHGAKRLSRMARPFKKVIPTLSEIFDRLPSPVSFCTIARVLLCTITKQSRSLIIPNHETALNSPKFQGLGRHGCLETLKTLINIHGAYHDARGTDAVLRPKPNSIAYPNALPLISP
jgi:hypothetical protein